jgi:hypothetical protein
MPIQARRIRYTITLSAVLLSAASVLQGCILSGQEQQRVQEERDGGKKLMQDALKGGFAPSEGGAGQTTRGTSPTPTTTTTPTTPAAPSGLPSTGTGGVPL